MNFISKHDLRTILKDEDYIFKCYRKVKEVPTNAKFVRFEASTTERNLQVSIYKCRFIGESIYRVCEKLRSFLRLVKENVLLVENIWIEVSETKDTVGFHHKENSSQELILCFSEYKEEIYYEIFKIYSLPLYLLKFNSTDKTSFNRISKLVVKLRLMTNLISILKEINWHFNMSQEGIYVSDCDEVFISGSALLFYEIRQLDSLSLQQCFLSPEYICQLDKTLLTKFFYEDMKLYSWQLGIIIATIFFGINLKEMVFTVTDLFEIQPQDIVNKLGFLLGYPASYDLMYMDTTFEFSASRGDMLKSSIGSSSSKRSVGCLESLLHLQMSISEREVFNLMKSCLNFNAVNRPSLEDLELSIRRISKLANYEETFDYSKIDRISQTRDRLSRSHDFKTIKAVRDANIVYNIEPEYLKRSLNKLPNYISSSINANENGRLDSDARPKRYFIQNQSDHSFNKELKEHREARQDNNEYNKLMSELDSLSFELQNMSMTSKK